VPPAPSPQHAHAYAGSSTDAALRTLAPRTLSKLYHYSTRRPPAPGMSTPAPPTMRPRPQPRDVSSTAMTNGAQPHCCISPRPLFDTRPTTALVDWAVVLTGLIAAPRQLWPTGHPRTAIKLQPGLPAICGACHGCARSRQPPQLAAQQLFRQRWAHLPTPSVSSTSNAFHGKVRTPPYPFGRPLLPSRRSRGARGRKIKSSSPRGSHGARGSPRLDAANVAGGRVCMQRRRRCNHVVD